VELDAYRASWRIPGVLEAALSYYRALKRSLVQSAAVEHAPTTQPTLIVWGMRDGALVPANTEGLERWVRDLRVVRIADAHHFVQSDAPEVVNAALVDFLRR